MAVLDDLKEAVVEGDPAGAVAGVKAGLAEGISAESLLKDGLIAAMQVVGRLYEEEDYYVPEMLLAAKAMTEALNILRPHLVETGVEARGSVTIGTVKGDLHDIGKNLVSMMLEGAGFAVSDLGVDVSADRFIEAIEGGAQVVAMSALLTTTMTAMKDNIDKIEAAGLRGRSHLIVGGAPVTKEFAEKIGADGFAPDASGAVRLVQQLLQV